MKFREPKSEYIKSTKIKTDNMWTEIFLNHFVFIWL